MIFHPEMADTIIFLYQKGRLLVLSNNAQKLEVKGDFRLFFLILHGFLQGKDGHCGCTRLTLREKCAHLNKIVAKTQVGFNSRYWPVADLGFSRGGAPTPKLVLFCKFVCQCWLHCHSNFTFSVTKIENLKWKLCEHINFITFGKFVTSLVQKLNRN